MIATVPGTTSKRTCRNSCNSKTTSARYAPSGSFITVLLKELREGHSGALESIMAAAYPELRKIARAYMARERENHTLQPTALIHEAWMRLADQTRVDWRDRAHFFGVAATMMRRVLVDYARQRLASKRGDGQSPVSLEWLQLAGQSEKLEEIVAVHEALDRLNSLRR